MGGTVTVGDGDAVGVSEGVGVSGLSNVPTGALARTVKKTIAPTAMTTASKMPTAAGKLSFTSGRRLACTVFSLFLTDLGLLGCAVNSVPHTRQRRALSLRRVPQVGQTFVLLEVGSGLIRAEIIPSNRNANFRWN